MDIHLGQDISVVSARQDPALGQIRRVPGESAILRLTT